MRTDQLAALPFTLLACLLLAGQTNGQGSGNAGTSTQNDSNNTSSTNTTISASFLTTYYPIFIAIVLLLLFLLGVTYKLRRRQKKLVADYASSRRQQALAQDVDGMLYSNSSNSAAHFGLRGPGMGGSSTHGRWYNPGSYMRRNDTMEGLDEHGMAPPPYKVGQVDANRGLDGALAARTNEDIPLRDMGRMSKPPEYGEVISEVPDEDRGEGDGRG